VPSIAFLSSLKSNTSLLDDGKVWMISIWLTLECISSKIIIHGNLVIIDKATNKCRTDESGTTGYKNVFVSIDDAPELTFM